MNRASTHMFQCCKCNTEIPPGSFFWMNNITHAIECVDCVESDSLRKEALDNYERAMKGI